MEPLLSTDSQEMPPRTREEEAGLSEDARQALFAEFRQEAQKERFRKRWYTVLLLFVLMPTLHFSLSQLLRNGEFSPLWFLPCSAAIGTLFFANWRYTKARKKSAVEKLATLQDVRAVGPLADILSFPDVHSRSLASQGLVTLLPRLKATDGALLNTQQRENLRLTLLSVDRPLILSVLRAYQQIGDERDLEAVKLVVKRNSGVARDPDVRQAALDCIPFLQEKANQNRISQTLLRASDQPSASPAELLCPALSTETTEPQQLLRPTTDRIL